MRAVVAGDKRSSGCRVPGFSPVEVDLSMAEISGLNKESAHANSKLTRTQPALAIIKSTRSWSKPNATPFWRCSPVTGSPPPHQAYATLLPEDRCLWSISTMSHEPAPTSRSANSQLRSCDSPATNHASVSGLSYRWTRADVNAGGSNSSR